MPESEAAWKRLGEMLEDRRVALDPRYKNLVRFTTERGIDYRLASDVEHARRTNYRRPTITAIEVAYGWRPGSIRLVLAGGEPVELDIAVTAPASPLSADEEQALASWREAVRLGVEQKRNEGRAPRRNGGSRSA